MEVDIRAYIDSFGSGGLIDINLNIYWGVKGIDKTGVSKWDAVFIGNVLWDEDFSFDTKEDQTSLIQLCRDLRSD